MYQHQEKRTSPFTPSQLYDLVLDITHYPHFLPWCKALRIKEKSENKIIAELLVGYKGFEQAFTSIIEPDPQSYRIKITYIDGPFKYLYSNWEFEATNNQAQLSTIAFDIEFEFRTKILDKLLKTVFTHSITRMVQAFEDRAEEIYGSSDADKHDGGKASFG